LRRDIGDASRRAARPTENSLCPPEPKAKFCKARTRGAGALALADAGERAEVREAKPRRGREGARGGPEGRGGSPTAASLHVSFNRGAGSSSQFRLRPLRT
jgi:hypothetical protein